jgi:hypothetical protein
MTTMTRVDPRLLAWLESGDCLPWLHGQARILLRQAGELGLPVELWPYPRADQMAAGELATAGEEVAHELWLFMRAALERGGPEPPPEFGEAGARLSLLGAYFRNGFLYRLRSQARRKQTSLHHYLYRRLREAVSQTPGFFHRAGRWGTLYSLESEGESVHTLAGLVDTAYAGWPSPVALVPERELLRFRAEDLHVLARLFWREAAGRAGRPLYLPCRELAGYLGAHYQCLHNGPGGPEAAQGVDQGVAAAQGPDQPAAANAATAERGALAMLAAQLVPRWAVARRRVFWLALDPGNLTLEQIAQQSGLAGASHAKYHLDRACQDIAGFCEGWPGAVPPSSDRGFWGEFLHSVAVACKNSLHDRSREK